MSGILSFYIRTISSSSSSLVPILMVPLRLQSSYLLSSEDDEDGGLGYPG